MTDVTARDEEADIVARHTDWVQLRLTGFSGRVAATQLVCRPDRPSRVLSSVPAPEGRSLIPRGGGQSHGDAALNDGGAVLLTGRLDRMLSFDPAGGVLVAEAGVTVGDILGTFLPRAHALAVCPANPATTIGGAIAGDVHGSNHMRAGSFGDHVVWLDLVTPRGGLRRVSREEEPQLFEATAGGMGLTGIIVRAALRLAPVTSAFVAVRQQAVGSLDALIEQLESATHAHEHASARIDALAGGLATGRGVLVTADITTAEGRTWRPMRATALPAWSAALARILPRRLVLRALAERRYRQAKSGASARPMPLDRFVFQPDAVSPSRGLHRLTRYQCVLPPDGTAAAIRRLLDIARRDGGAMRASAQAMGRQGRGMLTFARPGVCLVLDLPARPDAADLMHRLERETLDRGGRVSPAGNVHLTDHGFAAMYPRLDEFRAVLARIDPDMRMQSDLARRLRLRDYIV